MSIPASHKEWVEKTVRTTPIAFGDYAIPFSMLISGATQSISEVIQSMPSKSDADQETWESLKLSLEILGNLQDRIRGDYPVVTLIEKLNAVKQSPRAEAGGLNGAVKKS